MRTNVFKVFVSLLLLIQAIICNVSISSADEPEKTESVIVTGMGENPTTARQDAIKNAVQQVVGTLVNSETMAKDSMLINDEILTFSGGYVKESRVISTKVEGGLVNIRLEALVISTTLKRKIEALNIATKKIDGGSLFGEAFSKANTIKSGNELLTKTLSKYPQAAYKIELGKLEIGPITHEANKANIKVIVKLSFDNNFIDELESVLKSISYKQLSSVDISSWGHDLDKVSSRRQINDDTLVFLFSSNNSMLNRGIANNAYFVNIGKAVLENSEQTINGLANEYSRTKAVAAIQLIDSSGNVLDVIKTSFYDKDDKVDNFSRAGGRPLIMQAVYGNRIGRIKDLLLISNKTLSFDINFEADIAILDKVSSMKASFEAL